MAQVTLTIGDRPHAIACRDGEEAHFERLGAMLDGHWATAKRAAGGVGGERTMLFVALLLADALDEAQRRPAAVLDETLLADVADRLEAVAAALENGPENA